MNNSDRNLQHDSNNQDEAPRHNSLKNRIKQRAMAMDCDNTKEVHVSSVLAAASALASLSNQPASNTPPPTPEIPAAAGPMKLTIEQIMAAGNSHALPHNFDQDVPMTFPQKLMEILSNSSLADIVTWLPNGKGFIILQKRKFATEVMPMYFKHSKFTSFTRKLNRWGFTRVTRGPESGAYYHKYFQRGQHNLVMQMHCQSKIPPKDAPVKESPILSAIKSPGVSSAMSSLQLNESSSPAAAVTSFSASNPNIFAPDLTRQDDAGTAKFSTVTKPFVMNSHQNQIHHEHALRMLSSHQEMIRQRMNNSQRVFSQNSFHLSRLDPSFQQSRSFGYDRMTAASTRRHPMAIKTAMEALRHPENSGPRHASDPVPQTTLQRQDNKTPPAARQSQQYPINPQHSGLAAFTLIQRQAHPQMTDKVYLEMLKAKDQSEASARFVSALEAALGNPEQTHNMIKRALQEQMRSFPESQLTREAQEESLVSESKPSSVVSGSVAAKSSLAMTQKQVANLHDMAKSGQGKSRFPKAVRRASAA